VYGGVWDPCVFQLETAGLGERGSVAGGEGGGTEVKALAEGRGRGGQLGVQPLLRLHHRDPLHLTGPTAEKWIRNAPTLKKKEATPFVKKNS